LKLRLFFALWPDDPVRDALVAAARPLASACSGRPVAPRNYHLTLAFLGGVDGARLEPVRDAASAVRAEPFELVMDTHGHWAGPRVAWLGASRPPAAAAMLAGRLWDALEPLGFAREQRPFRPHLTVLRKCRTCEWAGPVARVCWPVRDFVLVKSETLPSGPSYEVLDRWAFAQERLQPRLADRD
jgi:RNA 2',3'-cyclic 3'-phosphodiesterase